MINKIFITFTTKVIAAILQFLLVMVTAQYLGTDGRGEISLIIATVTFIVIVNDIIGGGTLVYLIPRTNTFKLLIPSYIWAAISTTSAYGILLLTNWVPEQYKLAIFILSIMHAVFSIHIMVLLGKEQILWNNLLSLARVVILFGLLMIFFEQYDRIEVDAFVDAAYIAYGVTAAISFVFVLPHITPILVDGMRKVLGQMFRYGFIAQSSNILTMMNYRVSYYVLYAVQAQDPKYVGIYSMGVSLAEGIWLIANSIAMVQYARIANSSDKTYAQKLTLNLAKFSFYTTVIMLLPLLLLPESFYVLMFGDGFGPSRMVVWCISPGIASFGLSIILSHYFGGLGRYHVNTLAAFIGVVMTAAFCYLLIPHYHYIGAALTASISYSAGSCFLLWKFLKDTGYTPKDLLPSKSDFTTFVTEIKAYIKR